MEDDQKFLEMIVKTIVAHPDDVKVDREIDERGVLLTLNIHPEDMGFVIGRRGQTAQAIRTLLKIVGAKNNARVNLKIAEPEGSTRPERPARSENAPAAAPVAPAAEEEVDTSALDDLKI